MTTRITRIGSGRPLFTLPPDGFMGLAGGQTMNFREPGEFGYGATMVVKTDLAELLERAGLSVQALEFSNWSSHMQASSILGSYTIKHDGDDPDPWTVRFGSKMIACCNDVEAAKAAAQADYTARIISALEHQP